MKPSCPAAWRIWTSPRRESTRRSGNFRRRPSHDRSHVLIQDRSQVLFGVGVPDLSYAEGTECRHRPPGKGIRHVGPARGGRYFTFHACPAWAVVLRRAPGLLDDGGSAQPAAAAWARPPSALLRGWARGAEARAGRAWRAEDEGDSDLPDSAAAERASTSPPPLVRAGRCARGRRRSGPAAHAPTGACDGDRHRRVPAIPG